MHLFKDFLITLAIVAFLLLVYIIVFENNAVPACGPFTTSEWKACFDDCTASLAPNLKRTGFSNEEIMQFDVNQKCVDFCQEYLYHKREKEGCNKQ